MLELGIGTVHATMSHAASTGPGAVHVAYAPRGIPDRLPGSLAAATVAGTAAPAELTVDLFDFPQFSRSSTQRLEIFADERSRWFGLFEVCQFLLVVPEVMVELSEFEFAGANAVEVCHIRRNLFIDLVLEIGEFRPEVHLALDNLIANPGFRSMLGDPFAFDLGSLPPSKFLQIQMEIIGLEVTLKFGLEVDRRGHHRRNHGAERHRVLIL